MAMTKAGKRGGGGKWAMLGGLVLAGLVAVETGWAGWGFAQLRSSVFPRDEAILGWLPGDTAALLVVDPHQLKLESLGGDGSTVRADLDRRREDVKKATGIDLALDVDKLVVSTSIVVARGRFDGKKLAERLAEHRYVAQEHEGHTVLVRAGEDALAVIDDSILLYGDEQGVKAGLTAHAKGNALEQNEATTARLKQIGWDHALVATVRITDDKPSVREMLAGSAGPRAYSVSVGTTMGVDVDARVDAASPSAAEELAKLLEEKRKGGGALAPVTGPDTAAILADAANKATITADAASAAVRIHAHLDPAQVDALVKNAKTSAPLGELYKNVRLFQLLVPSP